MNNSNVYIIKHAKDISTIEEQSLPDYTFSCSHEYVSLPQQNTIYFYINFPLGINSHYSYNYTISYINSTYPTGEPTGQYSGSVNADSNTITYNMSNITPFPGAHIFSCILTATATASEYTPTTYTYSTKQILIPFCQPPSISVNTATGITTSPSFSYSGTIYPTPSTSTTSSQQTITATISDDVKYYPQSFEYSWYLNDDKLENTSSNTRGYNFTQSSTYQCQVITKYWTAVSNKPSVSVTYSNASYAITSSGTLTYTGATQTIACELYGGGGGGGNSLLSNSRYSGAGGGAGGQRTYTEYSLSAGYYTMTIGSGGAGGQNGSQTSAFNDALRASGGNCGQNNSSNSKNATGGTSTNSNASTGGNGAITTNVGTTGQNGIMPTIQVNNYRSNYAAGGGGGASCNSSSNLTYGATAGGTSGGGLGGGIAAGGNNATAYASGGGGAGATTTHHTQFNGGSGYQGIIFLKFGS